MHAIAQSENSITDTFRVTGDGARRVETDETKPSSKNQYDKLTKIQSPINSIKYRSLTRTSINKKNYNAYELARFRRHSTSLRVDDEK